MSISHKQTVFALMNMLFSDIYAIHFLFFQSIDDLLRKRTSLQMKNVHSFLLLLKVLYHRCWRAFFTPPDAFLVVHVSVPLHKLLELLLISLILSFDSFFHSSWSAWLDYLLHSHFELKDGGKTNPIKTIGASSKTQCVSKALVIISKFSIFYIF